MNLFLTILLSVLAAGITAFGVVSVTNNSNNTNANTSLPEPIAPQVLPEDPVALETENTDVVLEAEVSVSAENNPDTLDTNLLEEVETVGETVSELVDGVDPVLDPALNLPLEADLELVEVPEISTPENPVLPTKEANNEPVDDSIPSEPEVSVGVEEVEVDAPELIVVDEEVKTVELIDEFDESVTPTGEWKFPEIEETTSGGEAASE